MLYFKNTELADNHHITLRTVLNWIQAAKDGKLDLDLHTEKGKTYVANTARNIATIEELVEKRRKYRNTKAVKVITPRSEFYKLFNQEQIYDIVSNLEIYHELPRQYNYFNGGAGNWDKYAQWLAEEDAPNVLTRTVQLLDMNYGYIDGLLSKYKQVNIVDIGVGNALPVKGLLEYLLKKNMLSRYIALDISPDMLKIARRNIDNWFGDQIRFEGYEIDINYDRFVKILSGEYIKTESKDTINLVLLLGGTLYNFRAPDGAFRVIHDSMGSNDFLIHTLKLDSDATRRYFDFNLEPGKAILAPIHGFAVDLLNIDKSLYDVEMGFDEERHQRYSRIRLKVALTINFKFDKGERLVEFNKGDTILVWRSWQLTSSEVINQFDRNDFYMLQTSQTEDQEYMLTVSRVKRENTSSS